MKICYFGIYKPEESRNKIYMNGLRQSGVEIVECRDFSRGPLKYPRLFFKHWKIRNDYDVMIVGYPGHIVTPFAKLISKKKVVSKWSGQLLQVPWMIVESPKMHKFVPIRLYLSKRCLNCCIPHWTYNTRHWN